MTDKTDQRLRLTLRQLEVFVATARGGSTRAAAARVARSQSAASAALADLEAALGAPLFDRLGRRMLLSARGRDVVAGAVSLLDQAAALQAMLTSEQPAPLHLAASFTIGEYLLPSIVADWKQAQPHASARLVIGNTSDVIDAVVALEVDVGFIEGPQSHADVRTVRWLSDELVVFTAPSHALAGRAVGRRELADASWVLREMGSGTRDATDRWLLERLGRMQVDLEIGSSEAVKRVVASGVGVGCLSRHAVAEALQQGWLVELQTRLPRARRALSIVVHRQRRVAPGAQAFIDHCLGMATA